jgi:hypothetical protein
METYLRQRGLDLSNLPGALGPAFMILGQAQEKAQAQLGQSAFDLAWAEGQQLTPEQALAMATEDDSVDEAIAEALGEDGL